MTNSGCRQMGAFVAPYVDGELSGADRLRMSHHLESCAACAEGIHAAVSLGDLMRQAAAADPAVSRFEGLASDVVEQLRAESSVSWSARLERATGDSRLLWVGAGSVLGAAATTLVVAFSLFFNPAASSDSLAALIGGAGTDGTLMVIARPHGNEGAAILLEYGGPGPRVLTEASLNAPTEQEIVDALAQAVTRRGRIVWLADMSSSDRKVVEDLFAELSRRATKDIVQVQVEQVRFVTSTDVSAKGL